MYICICYQDSEVREVPYLLSQWRDKAPIDISDALKLLGRCVYA